MLKTEGLIKRYGALTAVDGVSFIAKAGEVLGFLGPNGAGKSTTMRMIAGFCHRPLARPVSRAMISSLTPSPPRALGYLPEGAPGYGEMTVEGFLRFIADLRGLKREAAWRVCAKSCRLRWAPCCGPEPRHPVEGLSASGRAGAGPAARSACIDSG